MCAEGRDPSSTPLQRLKKRLFVCVYMVVLTHKIVSACRCVCLCVKVSVRCDIPSVCSIDVENGSLFLSPSLCQLPFIPLWPSPLGVRIAKSIELNGVAAEAIECPF